MVKHWSQQISADVNREANRIITRKASQMMHRANTTQRHVSAGIDSGDDFSHQSVQVIANYDNFDQTIMGIDTAQDDVLLNRESQHMIEPGIPIMESILQDFTPLSLN